MKSEEKLNHLFETLRSEKAATSVSDVKNWLRSGVPTVKVKTANSFKLKKLMIMCSIVSISLTGVFFFFSSVSSHQSDEQQLERKVEVSSDDIVNPSKNQMLRAAKPLFKEEKGNESEELIASVPSLDFTENLEFSVNGAPALQQFPHHGEIIEHNGFNQLTKFASPTEKKRGIWRSVNDTLKVDTLFKNVKVLVFSGDFNDQILIKGSKRSDLSLGYTYERKTKGLIISGREHPIELSYELNDTILTIQLDRKVKVTVSFFSVTNEKNKLEFDVPENLEVQLKTEYGNIEAYGLRNKTNLHTSYGDFIAQDLSGEVKLDTDYGDILLKNASGLLKASSDYGDINSQEISGDIDLKTIYGDILTNKSKGMLNIVTEHGDVSGKSMIVEEWASVKSGYGEIDLQIVNPIDDFIMDLNTEFGDILLERSEMELKSQNRLKTGSGALKLNVKTEFGDIKIR